MAEKKYVVTLEEKSGALDSELFALVASKGDITSISVSEVVGKRITVNGTAKARIETDKKTFTMCYFNTLEYGIIHCGGGTLFEKSYYEYKEHTDRFSVTEIKCSLGTAFKAVPCMDLTSAEVVLEDVPFN